MKILYLDINIQYHNPTRNSIVLLLKSISELYIYGLGYQSQSVLNHGIEKFYEDNAPFDFVITNEHIIFGTQNIASDLATTVDAYKRNYYLQFDLLNIKHNLNEMFDFFEKVDNNRAIFLLESDYYNFQQEKIERLQSLDSYIIGWGDSFLAPIEKLEDLEKESFGARANDNWYNFVLNSSRVIQFPHFVNSSEFYFETLDNRKKKIQVSGTNYFHRRKVIDILNSSNYEISNKKIYNRVYSILRKLKVKPDGHPVLMRLYNILFRSEIEQSRYIFTCGSGLEWPIRKFFEIPAMGSLLLAKPFYNAKKLGFIDGENYIETDYKDIVKKLDWLENNKDVAQQIATKGQNMIWENHSLEARERQLGKSFEAILKKSFDGTYWEDGEFYVK